MNHFQRNWPIYLVVLVLQATVGFSIKSWKTYDNINLYLKNLPLAINSVSVDSSFSVSFSTNPYAVSVRPNRWSSTPAKEGKNDNYFWGEFYFRWLNQPASFGEGYVVLAFTPPQFGSHFYPDISLRFFGGGKNEGRKRRKPSFRISSPDSANNQDRATFSPAPAIHSWHPQTDAAGMVFSPTQCRAHP